MQVVQTAKDHGTYPLVHTGNKLPDVYEMMYALYKEMLKKYEPGNIYFLGGSSGATLALGLISYINDKGEGLAMPGKVYAGSPGSLLITDEENKMEVAPGMYHCYAVMPFVKEAMPAYHRMIEYINGG